MIAANQQPDHATIARFRVTHESAIAGLFGQVLAVCAREGLLRPGLVAIDGTRLAANASREVNKTAEQLAAEILVEAAAVDAAVDADDDARDAGNSTDAGGPDGCLRQRSGRRARLRALLDELEAEAAEHSYEAVMARRAEKEAPQANRSGDGVRRPPGRRIGAAGTRT